MAFAIELHFDDASTSRLTGLWSQLQSVYGAPRRTELGVRPHVSLAVLSEAPAALEEQIRLAAAHLAPFDIELGGVDHFPGEEGVIFIGAAASPPLRETHRRVTAALRMLGAANSPLYEPPQWRPHCTIATDVPGGLIADVITAAEAARRPRLVRAEALCGVSYRPATLAFQAALQAAA
jgi:2'-5' RNA ligase